MISLAEELPAEELFPLSLLAEAASTVISADAGALQYGDPAGYGPLREWLAGDWLKEKGVNVVEGGVLLTTGSQQAIDLLSRVYIDPGDRVLVENPTSPGFLQTLRMQGPLLFLYRVIWTGLIRSICGARSSCISRKCCSQPLALPIQAAFYGVWRDAAQYWIYVSHITS